MLHGDVATRCNGHGRGGLDDIARRLAVELQTEILGPDEHVVAAAVGDIDVDRAMAFHLQRHVERFDERRHAIECDPFATPVGTGGPSADQSGSGLQDHVGVRLGHRQAARLQQRGDHTDGV